MPKRIKRTLKEWLDWQETLHLSEIDLGLERISKVAQKLGILNLPFPIITVAGTNGKGSSITMLESILRAQGYQTGAYTSPHLINYNERITLNNVPASDAQICDAFEIIDQARGEISLTYFEFGTLAAILCFIDQKVDIALLEVGLGGRLDAANLWDASVAIITGIAIDHESWLGDDRETIGFEKAGIMRNNHPVVCGDKNPPQSIATHAAKIGAPLYQINQDFSYQINSDKKSDKEVDKYWTWQGWDKQQFTLPMPALKGEFQLNNAATVVSALQLLSTNNSFSITQQAYETGLMQAQIAGRLQHLKEKPEWLVDVAHNPQSAQQLAAYLKKHPCNGTTHAIFSMLADKDIKQVIEIMHAHIDHWHIFELTGNRAQSINTLEQQIRDTTEKQNITPHNNISSICTVLNKSAKSEDRVVAFGSFLVVSAVLETCA